MVREITLSGLGLPLTGPAEMGHFDTDSPAGVVICDADTLKVPRDGRSWQPQPFRAPGTTPLP